MQQRVRVWNCLQCTYCNEAYNLSCKMCGTRKHYTKAPENSVEIDLTLDEPKEEKKIVPEAIKVKSGKVMRCMGELVLKGHSIVNGPGLRPGDPVELDAGEGSGGIKRYHSSISSLLIRSTTGRRIGRLEAETATQLSYLLSRSYFHTDVTCASSPGRLSTFTPLTFKASIYVTDEAFEGTNAHDVFEFLTQIQKMGGQTEQRKKIQKCYDSIEERCVSGAALDSLYASCSGNSIKGDPQVAEHVAKYLKGLTLRDYQNQALVWMLKRELEDLTIDEKRNLLLASDVVGMYASEDAEKNMHPFWKKQYFFGDSKDEKKEVFYLNRVEKKVSLTLPPPPKPCLGGILADDMGMGKTIMILALLLTRKHIVKVTKDEKRDPDRQYGKTLVVCPLSLLDQWKSEILSHSQKDALSLTVAYSGEDTADVLRYDVVVTTYGVLSSAYSRAARGDRDSIFFTAVWERIVLDEVHSIKNPSTRYFKACDKLEATYRWGLTGTPIQNSVEDVHSIIRFLKYEPWNRQSWWKNVITLPFNRGDDSALPRLKAALSPIVLRRTKKTRDTKGELIVALPPKDIQIIRLEFSKEEREFYSAVFNQTRLDFQGVVGSSGKTNTNYIQILALLLRLRQTCDHPLLVFGRKTREEKSVEINQDTYDRLMKEFNINQTIEPESEELEELSQSNTYLKNVIQELQDEGLDSHECPICLDTPTDPIITRCAHILCLKCATDYLERDECSDCPVCKQPVSVSQFLRLRFPNQKKKQVMNELYLSTKLKQLNQDLKQLGSCRKVVVFSQWTHMLDLVETSCAVQKIQCVRFDGTMNRKAREQVLSTFNTNPKCQALIVSLRAGGVGLNLTAASVVIMLDPWWNPAIEDQAIDRVHRLGQHQNVLVKKYVVRDTIEDMILQLQERKAAIANSVLTIGHRDQDEGRLNLDDLIRFFSKG